MNASFFVLIVGLLLAVGGPASYTLWPHHKITLKLAGRLLLAGGILFILSATLYRFGW
ncbi:MAG TPA: hypothetical protein VJH94_04295 [Candidatus Paceibacterota bacterium]